MIFSDCKALYSVANYYGAKKCMQVVKHIVCLHSFVVFQFCSSLIIETSFLCVALYFIWTFTVLHLPNSKTLFKCSCFLCIKINFFPNQESKQSSALTVAAKLTEKMVKISLRALHKELQIITTF